MWKPLIRLTVLALLSIHSFAGHAENAAGEAKFRRTAVVSSEQPLHADAAAVYGNLIDFSGHWEMEHAKREVAVKEINCATQARRYGWLCSIAQPTPKSCSSRARGAE